MVHRTSLAASRSARDEGVATPRMSEEQQRDAHFRCPEGGWTASKGPL